MTLSSSSNTKTVSCSINSSCEAVPVQEDDDGMLLVLLLVVAIVICSMVDLVAHHTQLVSWTGRA